MNFSQFSHSSMKRTGTSERKNSDQPQQDPPRPLRRIAPRYRLVGFEQVAQAPAHHTPYPTRPGQFAPSNHALYENAPVSAPQAEVHPYPSVTEDWPSTAPPMPVTGETDDPIDAMVMMQRPDLTKAEALRCARLLVSITDDSDILRFTRSKTGLVEAVLYYHSFASNLDVVQRAASLARCQTLSGTHGEWTRGDDFLTAVQHSFVTRYGLKHFTPAFPTGLVGCIYSDYRNEEYPVWIREPSQYYVLRPHLVWYRSANSVTQQMHGTWITINEPADWGSYFNDTYNWLVDCPELGMSFMTRFTVNKPALEGFGEDGETFTCSMRAFGMAMEWFKYNGVPPSMQSLTEDEDGPPGWVAFLNGNNGEATNTDDVKNARRARGKARPPPRRNRRAAARPAGRPRPRQPRSLGIGLSSCALKYARAIAAPFAPDAMGACVPVFPSPDSMKSHSYQRSVSVIVGSGGVGGVFLSPSAHNNIMNVAATTGQYPGTSLELPAVEAVGDYAYSAPTSLPFNYSSDVRARLVSFGVKIKYTGTQLDMGGIISGFFDPSHDPVATETWTPSKITSRPYASFESVDRRMNFVLQTAAVNSHETVFEDGRCPYSEGATTGVHYDDMRANAIGVIMIVGKPGTTYNLEVVTHVEYVGAAASSGATQTHTDARGFEMVQQASGQLASATANNRESSWTAMQRLLGHAARELAPVAAQGISLVARGIASQQRRALGFH